MAKQNAYSMFVKEEARRRQRNGSNVNFNSLFKELDPKWRSLSEKEKQKYKDRASNCNQNNSFSSFSPQACQSISASSLQPASVNLVNQVSNSNQPPPASIEQRRPPNECRALVAKRPYEGSDCEPQRAKKKMRPGIPSWRLKSGTGIPDPAKFYSDFYLLDIRNACESIVKSRVKNLVKTPIYAFSANVLCMYKEKVDDDVTEEIYVPLEVSLFAYSLLKGDIGKPYHVMIDAGSIPQKCVNSSADHAEKTHKIALPNSGGYPDGARSDYKKIYKEMTNYTHDGERTILVADHRDLKQVKGCLEWLYKKASEDGSKQPKVSTWTILTVTEFVGSMFNYCHSLLTGNSSVFAIYYHIKMKLGIESIMDYNDALMCDYHAKEGNYTKWCAQGCAKRTFYNLKEILEMIYQMYMCATGESDQAPTLQDGLFLPQIAQTPAATVGQPQSPSNQASKSFSQLPACKPDEGQLPALPATEPLEVCEALPAGEPILAIEAPDSMESRRLSLQDPRIKSGRIRPASPKQDDDTSEVMFVDIDPNIDSEIEPPSASPPPKKLIPQPEEPLIVTSSKGPIQEYPPDIY